MGAKEARRKDDWQDDPDNPVVPFRMSDRLEMFRLRWLMIFLALLIAAKDYAIPAFGTAMGHSVP